MIAAWASGLWLIWEAELLYSGWMLGKLALVFMLTMLHGLDAKWVKDFSADRNWRSARFYRFANEAPTLLMILIVVLVVVKPF
jgi:putative membrane protein